MIYPKDFMIAQNTKLHCILQGIFSYATSLAPGSYLLLLGISLPLFLCGQPNAILSNPSVCGLNEPLTDYNCPENSNFYNPDIFEIQVNNAPGTALGTDVYLQEVRLIVTHPWVSDMNFALRSPSGVVAQLMGNIGGNGDNFGDTSQVACAGAMVLALGACELVTDGLAPFANGPYRAEEDFYIFNDETTNPNGSWELLICDDLDDDSGMLQYVELVFAPLLCLPIQDITLLSQDSTTATFTYAPLAECGPAIVEIGPPGFTPGTDADAGGGEVFFVGCPPFTLTNLTEDTDYDIYLRRSCAATAAYSINSCVSTFQTGCSPAPVSLLETFDEQENCQPFCGTACELTGNWRNVSNDNFDWLTYSGPTPTLFGTGPVDDITMGGNYVYIEANGSQCALGSKAYLQSACLLLDKQGSDSCHLSFNYHMSGINTGSLRIEASVDGGFNWTELWRRTGRQGADWKKAYIGLGDYPDGSTLQLRFVGTKGNGIYGDIAIDQIRLHGSQTLGFPENFLYADADGDSFGDDGGIAILTCLDSPPPGYSFNALDCNDNNENIFPGAEEVPCNGIDENCNAATLDDDSILPPPITTSDTVCSGELPLLSAEAEEDFQVFWYTNADRSGGAVWVGNTYSPALPANTTAFPQTYEFYAEVTNFSCSSPVLGVVSAMVLPLPRGNVVNTLQVCPDEEVDLASIDIQDDNFTGANITFHSFSPATSANELPSTLVSPMPGNSYTYLMTSPDGCTFEDQFSIDIKAVPVISFLPSDSFSLCRESRDTVIAMASGGAGDYNYLWNTGRTGNILPVQGDNTAGSLTTYQLTVTDSDGCRAIDSVLLQTTNSIDSIRLFTSPVTTCEGMDGQITIVPLNGLAPFSYSWEDAEGNMGNGSGLADTIFITNLSQSAYRVTVTDNSAQGCQVLLRNIRIQGPGFQVGETALTTPACAGFDDGAICMNVSGSIGITYQWSDGQTTACAENLTAGTYSVTITNGECTTIESYILLEPDSLSLSGQDISPACHDSSDGQLQIVAFGGTSPYNYEWETGILGQTLSNIASGDYVATLTDANNCILVDTFSLQAPDPLTISIDSLENISCPGLDDGLLLVSGAGGTPPCSYLWDNGSTAPLQLSLSSGSYALTVTDFNNCSSSSTIVIEEPSALSLSIADFTAPICLGDNTGRIELLGQGGVSPYQVYWNDGFQSSSLSRDDLAVGEYEIVLRDANGCQSDTLFFTLAPQSNLSITADVTEPTCVGLLNGAIAITASGQTPFEYEWSTPNIGANLLNIGVGDYGLTVTDARGCIKDTLIKLTANQVFSINSTVVQPSCFGVNDGIIDQTLIEQGLPPFQFFWSNATQHVDQLFLGPGDYQYTVSDAIGCTFVSDTFNISYPDPLQLEVLDSDGIACSGDETGFFETTAVGGTSPYSYNWIGTGITTSNVYNLTAGNHRLSITDGRGCTVDTLLMLDDPAPLFVSASLQNGDVCDPDDTDVLVSTVSGGVMPYSYVWTNRVETAVINDPDPGDYFLTVTDANGCEAVFGTIKVQEGIAPLVLDSFRVTQVNCFQGMDATATAYVSGGSDRLRYHFTPTYITETDTNTVTISGLAYDDGYSVTVTDMVTGCEVTAPEVVGVQPPPIAIHRDSFTVVNCFGGADGSIYVSVTGGTGDFDYLWTNAAGNTVSMQEDLRFAGAQIYQLLVTDENGCTATYGDSNVVAINELIVISDTLVTPVACRNDATGAIAVEVGGGFGPYSYSWSNGMSGQQIENLTAGIYTLTVTDADTCRAIFPGIIVTQPQTAITLTDTLDLISCFGLADGRIALNINGGGPPYNYRWRRNDTLVPTLMGPLIENLTAANYRLVLTDTNDCEQQYLFSITQPDELLVTIVNQPTGADSLRAVPMGGTMPYTYLWSTGAETPLIENLSSNFYEVQIVDANGCIVSDNYQLTETEQLSDYQGGIRVYPNPTSGLVYLSFDRPLAERTTLSIVDGLGRLLNKWDLTMLTQYFSFDLADYPEGVYTIRVGDKHILRLVKTE